MLNMRRAASPVDGRSLHTLVRSCFLVSRVKRIALALLASMMVAGGLAVAASPAHAWPPDPVFGR
jgi:hypothetical protein